MRKLPRHHIFNRLTSGHPGHEPIAVAVCFPCSDVALVAAVEAAEHGLIVPTLIGPLGAMRACAAEAGLDLAPYALVDVHDDVEAARKSVELCRFGKTQALMKGSLHTDVMMHEVMLRETGLATSRRISHVFVLDAPAYPRPLILSDAAINISPTLEEKVDILRNAIDVARVLRIDLPKVAVLSAVETVTPKIASTIDAAALCKMAERGQIVGAVVDGPLAFDTAVSAEAAAIKQLVSPVAGCTDIFIVPDLESGNMLAKQLEYLGGAKGAGIVLGARVPIILTSRADSAEMRLASAALALMYVSAQSKLAPAANLAHE
ncbi:MAG: bifunctional enoyl-CoA hydratase/phosphate acetyltransferase [Vulcanimicrobiaceae bacterium]